MRSSELVSSNCIEFLVEKLIERLFAKGSSPFVRRLVVVPNEGMREFLLYTLASKCGVAAGIQIAVLPQSFVSLFDQLDTKLSIKRIPSFLELSLQIEALLSDTDAPEVQAYVSSPARMRSLSDQLSRVFSRYGLYGEEFVDEWVQQEGWQQDLWKKVYAEQTPWTYPLRAFSLPFSVDAQLHLFGFHFLPRIYVSFFERLGAQFYQFSCCREFWEDLSSDKEKIKTERWFRRAGVGSKDVEAWRRFTADSHPLLANWGKVGREFSKRLEIEGESAYREPEGNGVLAAVQRGILEVDAAAVSEVVNDLSIQVHSAPTQLREIEVLYNGLCGLLHHDRELNPREILVLAPDISVYAPLIHMVFGAQESQLNYAIHGDSRGKEGDLVPAFIHLFSLAKSQFAVDEVLKLLEFRCVSERWDLSSEEVSTLSWWVRQAKIRWGWDEHEIGSWVYGLDRLLFGLAVENQSVCALYPCPVVDLTQMDLLEKGICFFRQLHADMELVSAKGAGSIADWLEICRGLALRYCCLSPDLSFLAKIQQLGESLYSVQQKCFTYESIELLLSHLTSSLTTTHSAAQRNKIAFASMQGGVMQSAKVVWLLGMDEASFPRSIESFPLCEMGKKAPYIPIRSEEDRYAFLSALSLAQGHFIMSYVRVNREDHKAQGLSLVAEELLQFLSHQYGVDPSQITWEHPTLGFDADYFSSDSRFISYYPSHFAAAKWYYGPVKPAPPLIGQPLALPQREEIFEIKKLELLAKNPVRFFLQQTLAISMRFKEDEHEEFVVSPLLKSRLRKSVLHGDLEERLAILKEEGALPLDAYYPVALHQILEETKGVQHHLDRHHFATDGLISVELSLACKEPIQRSFNHWIVPALKVDLSDGRQGAIVGTLDHVGAGGLLVDGKEGIADGLRCWPQFLIYHNLPLFADVPVKAILLTKQGKLKEGSLENPLQALVDYLDYYERARRNISWLMPDWVSGVISGKEKQFAEQLAQIGEGSALFADEYLLWIKRRQALPSAQDVFSQISRELQKTFKPMQELWNLLGREHAEV